MGVKLVKTVRNQQRSPASQTSNAYTEQTRYTLPWREVHGTQRGRREQENQLQCEPITMTIEIITSEPVTDPATTTTRTHTHTDLNPEIHGGASVGSTWACTQQRQPIQKPAESNENDRWRRERAWFLARQHLLLANLRSLLPPSPLPFIGRRGGRYVNHIDFILCSLGQRFTSIP